MAGDDVNELPETSTTATTTTTTNQPTTSAGAINISIEPGDTSDDEHAEHATLPANITSPKMHLVEQIRMEKLLRGNEANGTNNNTKSKISPEFRLSLKRHLHDTLSTQAEGNNNNAESRQTSNIAQQQPEASFQIKTLDQIRKEREEKEKLKENQIPDGNNKRGYDASDNDSTQVSSRPIKLRRNRAGAVRSSVEVADVQSEQEKAVVAPPPPATSTSAPIVPVPESNVSGGSTQQQQQQQPSSVLVNNNPATQFVSEGYDDLSFLELDADLGLPIDANGAANLANLDDDDDDDLMREINQVINS